MEIFVCEYCERSIEVKNPTAQRGTKSAHLGKCPAYQSYVANILSKDFLEKEYIENGKSANEIAGKLGLRAKAIISACERHGISKRNISQSKLEARCAKKYKDTNLARYGSPHNMCRSHPARKKMIENLYAKHGVENVFQRPDVKDKIDIWFQTDGSRGKRLPGGRYSKGHQTIDNYLKIKEVDHVNEFAIKYDDNKRYYYDIAIPHRHLLIEINGDRVHGNPEFYKQEDTISLYGRDFVVGDKWLSDTHKLQIAENNGWYVFYIWGSEIAKFGSNYIGYILSLNDEQLAFACRVSWGYLDGDLNS